MPSSDLYHPPARALNGTTPAPSTPRPAPPPAPSHLEWLSILDGLEARCGDATTTLQQELASYCRSTHRPTREAIERRCREVEAQLKVLLGMYKAVTKLAEIDREIALARVILARKCATIANYQTELHKLTLDLAHRCEECHQPLHKPIVEPGERRTKANAHFCGDCAARRKAQAETKRRKARSKRTFTD